MSDDLAKYVESIFTKHVPNIDYIHLKSKSERNTLLSHYLLEHLTFNKVTFVLNKNPKKDCVINLCLADETLRYSKKSIIFLPSGKLCLPRESKSDKKGGVRLGRVYPKSKVDKYVLVSGIKIYRSLINSKDMPGRDVNKDISYLLDHPAFRKISEGANPLRAANCYLEVLNDKIYNRGIEKSSSSSDLRKLICFKAYHERTFNEDLKLENIDCLNSDSYTVHDAFLKSVMNWNKDMAWRIINSVKV